MTRYYGEYILIQDFETPEERIVEHNEDMKEIIRLAENYPKDTTMISYEPPSGMMLIY